MHETGRELQALVTIARVDATLNDLRNELDRLPVTIQDTDKALINIESNEQTAASKLDELAKERRDMEQGVEDNTVKITKYKNQLMSVKTNKEYQAMLHEIEHLEKDIDSKEERLLMLMEEFEQEQEQHDSFRGVSSDQKANLTKRKTAAEARILAAKSEIAELEAQKPDLLRVLPDTVRRRYDRVLAKLKDYAVTHTIEDVCQGCFTRIPPQSAVEVRRNEKLITCEGCGRLLVHYVS